MRGRRVIPLFAYYGGDGEWSTWENGKVYYTRKAMRRGLREALDCLPEGADDAVAFIAILD